MAEINLNEIVECSICGQRGRFGSMFGDRCEICQATGFEIWGFGEWCEKERNKLPIEKQRELIFKKRKETKDV